MLRPLLAALDRRRPRWMTPNRAPEPSVTLRALVLAAQLLGTAAAALETRLFPVWLVGAIGLVLGHIYAGWAVRHRKLTWVRVLAFVGFHLLLGYMVVALFAGLPYPQAQLAILATAVVAPELFSRMNLNSGLGLAFINLYVAATLSRGMAYGAFLLGVAGLCLATLWTADALDAARAAHTTLTPNTTARRAAGGRLRWTARTTLVACVALPVVLLALPRFAGRPLFLPVTFRVPISAQPSASVINPAVPVVQLIGQVRPDDSEYYYGFADVLDLGYRGGLTDTVMMIVNTPVWTYFRGYAFDAYDGRTWRQSDNTLRTRPPLYEGGVQFRLARPPWGTTFVQSVYVMQPMPNIVYTGGDPVEVHFAAREIATDSTGGVRAGQVVAPGTTYSVISRPTNADADVLRAAPPPDTNDPALAAYLALPPSVTARTRELAASLAASAPTAYDKVVALRDTVRDSFPYDFYPPPQPPNTDAVDQFLFVDQRGVCEQYTSALVVMLRAQGIPARFVVGFGAGERNLITGYTTIRANDAHAWVEVYFSGVGWVPFDATPGWDPNPQTGPVRRWLLDELWDAGALPRLPIAEAASVMGGVFGALARVLPWLALAGGLGVSGVLAWRAWRNRTVPLHTDPARRAALRLFARALRQAGVRRGPGQTAQEAVAGAPMLRPLADLADAAAYRPVPPSVEDVRQASTRLGRVRRVKNR